MIEYYYLRGKHEATEEGFWKQLPLNPLWSKTGNCGSPGPTQELRSKTVPIPQAWTPADHAQRTSCIATKMSMDFVSVRDEPSDDKMLMLPIIFTLHRQLYQESSQGCLVSLAIGTPTGSGWSSGQARVASHLHHHQEELWVKDCFCWDSSCGHCQA